MRMERRSVLQLHGQPISANGSASHAGRAKPQVTGRWRRRCWSRWCRPVYSNRYSNAVRDTRRALRPEPGSADLRDVGKPPRSGPARSAWPWQRREPVSVCHGKASTPECSKGDLGTVRWPPSHERPPPRGRNAVCAASWTWSGGSATLRQDHRSAVTWGSLPDETHGASLRHDLTPRARAAIGLGREIRGSPADRTGLEQLPSGGGCVRGGLGDVEPTVLRGEDLDAPRAGPAGGA
jgi:hypothetical protein